MRAPTRDSNKNKDHDAEGKNTWENIPQLEGEPPAHWAYTIPRISSWPSGPALTASLCRLSLATVLQPPSQRRT